MKRYALTAVLHLAAACALLAAPAGRVDPLEKQSRLFDLGRYSEVISALPSAAMQKLHGKNLARATLLLAASHERTHRLDKALSVYQLGIKLYPNDIPLLAGLAQLYHASHLEEQAQPLYNKILAAEPDNTTAHLGLASINHTLGLLDKSAQHYEEALERLQDNAAIWRDYAEVLYAQREYKTAELAIERSLALSPQILDSNLDLAFIQRAQGRLPEALATLEKVLALTGNQPEILSAYALWLLEAGKTAQALAQAELILKNAPADPLGRWIRARIHLASGQRDLAAKDLAVAAESNPDSFIAKTAAALLKQARP